MDGRRVRVHRWAYEHYVGPIPYGYEIEQICHNAFCARPEHLVARESSAARGRARVTKNRGLGYRDNNRAY